MKEKNKNNDSNTDYLQPGVLGNIFIGNLFSMADDLDNSGQNLAAYLEVEEIKKLSKEKQNKRI